MSNQPKQALNAENGRYDLWEEKQGSEGENGCPGILNMYITNNTKKPFIKTQLTGE